jgi:hypothetical protein
MRRSTLLFACVWAGWLASSASAASLFGAAYDGTVYQIDQLTGSRQPFMADANRHWVDATDGADPMTFFATEDGGSLYKIDLVNKAVDPVGDYGAIAAICTLGYAEPPAGGGAGVLYGSDLQSLYTIAIDGPNAGAATFIAAIHGAGDVFIGVGSMDYDPDAQRLYIVNDFGASSKLYYVNTTDGLATLIGSLAVPVSDIWYDRDSHKLYGAHQSNTQLYEINTANADVTPIGVTPTGDEACERIFGLGGPNVPEPGTIALLGLGVIGFLRPRLRRAGR